MKKLILTTVLGAFLGAPIVAAAGTPPAKPAAAGDEKPAPKKGKKGKKDDKKPAEGEGAKPEGDGAKPEGKE